MTEITELSPEAEKLLPALHALPAKDRLGLAKLLLADSDIPDADPAEVRVAWKAEIRRRVEEIKSGKVIGIPAEEVDRRMREKFG
jgi:putative addiction module component (TIGR02574 family)